MDTTCCSLYSSAYSPGKLKLTSNGLLTKTSFTTSIFFDSAAYFFSSYFTFLLSFHTQSLCPVCRNEKQGLPDDELRETRTQKKGHGYVHDTSRVGKTLALLCTCVISVDLAQIRQFAGGLAGSRENSRPAQAHTRGNGTVAFAVFICPGKNKENNNKCLSALVSQTHTNPRESMELLNYPVCCKILKSYFVGSQKTSISTLSNLETSLFLGIRYFVDSQSFIKK